MASSRPDTKRGVRVQGVGHVVAQPKLGDEVCGDSFEVWGMVPLAGVQSAPRSDRQDQGACGRQVDVAAFVLGVLGILSI